MWAARLQNEAMTKTLLERGADPKQLDRSGHDAYWWAMRQEATRAVLGFNVRFYGRRLFCSPVARPLARVAVK